MSIKSKDKEIEVIKENDKTIIAKTGSNQKERKGLVEGVDFIRPNSHSLVYLR